MKRVKRFGCRIAWQYCLWTWLQLPVLIFPCLMKDQFPCSSHMSYILPFTVIFAVKLTIPIMFHQQLPFICVASDLSLYGENIRRAYLYFDFNGSLLQSRSFRYSNFIVLHTFSSVSTMSWSPSSTVGPILPRKENLIFLRRVLFVYLVYL